MWGYQTLNVLTYIIHTYFISKYVKCYYYITHLHWNTTVTTCMQNI